MTTQMSPIAAAYVRSINDRDSVTFIALFADAAVVNDAGREFRGVAAIKAWSDRDIFDAQVTLEVIEVACRNGATVVTTIVDGNFDRTGLPDPVIINHYLTAERDKIVRLACQLAGEQAGVVSSPLLNP